MPTAPNKMSLQTFWKCLCEFSLEWMMLWTIALPSWPCFWLVDYRCCDLSQNQLSHRPLVSRPPSSNIRVVNVFRYEFELYIVLILFSAGSSNSVTERLVKMKLLSCLLCSSYFYSSSGVGVVFYHWLKNALIDLVQFNTHKPSDKHMV